jgi:hypothetical protein
MVTEIPRGTVIGKVTGGPPLTEAEHFFKCEMCGGWLDIRDLGAVLDHEEPLPDPECDQAQQRGRIISAASSGVGAMRRGHLRVPSSRSRGRARRMCHRQASHERGRQVRRPLAKP